jgi:hypothetical protein
VVEKDRRTTPFSATRPRPGTPADAVVHAADIQDRDGGPLVIESMHGLLSFVTKLFADGGY